MNFSDGSAMLFAKFFHLLGLTIWVGGMFFAHMALRPALGVLHPEQRLSLMAAVLANFFIWVWVAIALVLGSGLHMMAVMGAGAAKLPPYVHAHQVVAQRDAGTAAVNALGQQAASQWRIDLEQLLSAWTGGGVLPAGQRREAARFQAALDVIGLTPVPRLQMRRQLRDAAVVRPAVPQQVGGFLAL